MPIVSISEFSGLNSFDSPYKIDEKQLADCVNFDISDRKTLRKRAGNAKLTSGTLPWTNRVRIRGRFKTSTKDEVIMSDGTNGFKINVPPVIGAPITYAQGATADGVQYDNKWWGIRTFSPGLIKYDGNLWQPITGTPVGTSIIVYKDRMFKINSNGTNGDESKIAYTELYAAGLGTDGFVASSWGSSNFINVDSGDGDKIIALYEFNDLIYIFKTRSIYSLYAQSGSPEDWVLKKITSHLGLYSKNTVLDIDGLMYFEARDGIYRTDGITFEEVSAPVRNYFQGRTVDADSYDDDSAIYWLTKLIIFKVDRTVAPTPTILVFDIVNNSWVQYKFISPLLPWSALVLPDKSPYSVLIADYTNGGHIYRFGTGYDDNGLAYSSSFKTKLFTFDQQMQLKRCNKAFVSFYNQFDAAPHNFYANWYDDRGELVVTNLIDRNSEFLSKYGRVEGRPIAGPGYFRGIQFSFSDDGPKYNVEFYEVSMDIREKSTVSRKYPTNPQTVN